MCRKIIDGKIEWLSFIKIRKINQVSSMMKVIHNKRCIQPINFLKQDLGGQWIGIQIRAKGNNIDESNSSDKEMRICEEIQRGL